MGNRISKGALVIVLLALFAAGFAATAAEEKWPPITPEDMALKDCARQPGAPAVYLYREGISSDEEASTKIFWRIKVLAPAGKEYANVEIPVVKGRFKIKDLRARVVSPAGESREYTGQIIDKTVLRAGRTKVTVKAFALPDVEVGSIIDCRYKIVPDSGKADSSETQGGFDILGRPYGKIEEGGVPASKEVVSWYVGGWEIQAPLYTYKARFSYMPYHMGQIFAFGRNMRLGWVSHGLIAGPPEMSGSEVTLHLEDVPAFETEENMPPDDAGQIGVDFFFVDNTVSGGADYWTREIGIWSAGAEAFMELNNDISTESFRITSGTTEPLLKLRRLYERAQAIRNLSYDRSLTPQRRRELKIMTNRTAAEVLKNGYGLRSDITRTFVALVRAAGLTAELARVVTRNDKFFHDSLISLYRQFDSEIAVVKTGDQELFLDPATPFCPFGVTRWECSDTTYIRTRGFDKMFRTSPVSSPDAALTRRELALELDAGGNLTGTAKVSFSGQEALARRLEHLEDDDLAIKKDLEAEMAELLPAGANVSLENVENMKNSEETVRADFRLNIPGVATASGQRLLLPASPFQGSRRRPFRHAERRYPVYFSYPYREVDEIVIALPAGATVETTPAARKNTRSFSEHTLNCAVEPGPRLRIRRDLAVKQSLIRLDLYPALKSFFDQVGQGDEEQIVLSPPVKK